MFGAKQLPLNRMKQMNSAALAPNTKLDSVVELTGIEPVASWLQTGRSPS